MSVQSNEPGQQQQQSSGAGPDNTNDGHPAWQELLSDIPEAFHPLVKSKLEEWDKGTKDHLAKVRETYDPYKTFVDNKVDPNLLQQAVGLVQAIEADPEAVLKDLIENFELDYVPASQVDTSSGNDDDDDDFFGDGKVDITKHPAFQQLSQQLEQVTGKLSKQEQEEQQKAATEQHRQALEALHVDPNDPSKRREFDDMFVTALMSQGASGEEAVKQYYGIVNQAAAQIAGQQQQNTQPPPVVMGGDGTTGSGLPESGADMGSMQKNAVNDLVASIIAKASES